MTQKIPLARYLFTRLRQQNVQHMHGVPGDFTLKALDHLPPAGLQWINSCNELNAGYAADGYARIRGLGALFTTYGVGELSAINAVAGSYAEHVPVVSIVGTPQRHLQRQRANVHHTLGDGRPGVFAEMAAKVTVRQVDLVDERDAADMVDEVVAACVRESRPVYVGLPCDMVRKEVDGARLQEGLKGLEVESDPVEERPAIGELLRRLTSATKPLILVDSGHGVRGLREEINDFVEKSGIPTLAMPSGNGMVEHSLRNFYGVHSGPVGQIDTMPYVREADLVLAFGPMFSDTQTLGWTVVPDAAKTITLTKKSIHFPDSRTETRINLRSFLTSLAEEIRSPAAASSLSRREPDTSSLGDFRSIQPSSASTTTTSSSSSTAPIDQANFYLRLNTWLRPHDTILLANATPILGGRDLILPRGAKTIASGQWFSIGHMLPAAQGAALARLQPVTANNSTSTSPSPSSTTKAPPRTILLEGDGSFQATTQELSTVIRYRIPLTIFLVNNSGYAYERQIHGMHEDYNDLAPWRYAELAAKFFGADDYPGGAGRSPAYPVWSRKVSTWRELDVLLDGGGDDDGGFKAAESGLRLVEVVVGKYDIPEKFAHVFRSAGEKLG